MGKRRPYVYDPTRAANPGDVLDEIMHHSRLSMIRLASMLGCSRQHVYHLVTGRSAITASMAIKLERAGLPLKAETWMQLDAEHRLRAEREREKVHG